MSRGAFDQGVAKREGVTFNYAQSRLISLFFLQAPIVIKRPNPQKTKR